MIRDIIINYLPAFVLGFVFVFCTFRYIGTFKNMANEIKDYSSFKKLEDQVKCLLNELYAEKKTNEELKNELNSIKDQFIELSNEYELKLEHKDKEE